MRAPSRLARLTSPVRRYRTVDGGRAGVVLTKTNIRARILTLCLAGIAAAAVGVSAASTESSGGSLGLTRPASAVAPAPYKVKLISNRDAFGDAQKDPSGNAATDISDVTILNDKGGTMIIVITIDQTSLFSGDEVDAFIDTDRNLSTGCTGAEYVLAAVGFNDPTADRFVLGRCSAGRYDFAVPQGSFVGALDTARRQVGFRFDAAAIGGSKQFNYAIGTFWSPTTTATYRDYAPDTGYFTFALERAKIPCKTVFARLVRDPGWVGVISGGVLVLRSLRMRGVPAGATVTFRSRSVTERVRAGKSGIANSRRMLNRRLEKGRVILVQIKSGTCSTSIRLRVNSQGRLVRSG